MKLQEIIKKNEDESTAILIEKMVPHKKALLKHFSDEFPSEPMLMVVSITNATSYGRIVPSAEFQDALEAWLDADEDLDDEERESAREIISFQSLLLSDL